MQRLTHSASIQAQILLLVRALGVILVATNVLAAASPWQAARIVDVTTSVNTRTTAWVVNTPIQDEETICTIRVHFRDKIFQGSYKVDSSHAAPPAEWVKHAPVRAQFADDRMYLKALTGEEYKFHIETTKSAPMMDPLTPEEVAAEKAAVVNEQAPPKSMIGFDDAKHEPSKPTPAETQPSVPPPPPPEPTTGTVTVSSMPYLAEVYVDGENMGYTPAKIKLPPGKHSFRCEKAGYKPWNTEITVTTGSELTLDATLALNRK